MLVISNKQVAAFKPELVVHFVDEMLDHARQFFPNHMRLAGETAMRATAGYAIELGKQHGWRTQKNVFLLFNNMLLLGSHFMSDPQYPWIAELVEEGKDEPGESIELVSDRVTDYFERVAGEQQLHLNRALQQLSQRPEDILLQLQQCDAEAFEVFFEEFFQSKYEALGEDVFRDARNVAERMAKDNGMKMEGDAWTYVLFAFLAGSGFARDPLYPWVPAILHDKQLESREKSVMLYQKGVAVIRSFMNHPITQNQIQHV
jgi:hypothetical protein